MSDQSLKDRGFSAKINTLDFYCDWGSAEEYMDIMIDVIEKTPGEDYVLARGECTYASFFPPGVFTRTMRKGMGGSPA